MSQEHETSITAFQNGLNIFLFNNFHGLESKLLHCFNSRTLDYQSYLNHLIQERDGIPESLYDINGGFKPRINGNFKPRINGGFTPRWSLLLKFGPLRQGIVETPLSNDRNQSQLHFRSWNVIASLTSWMEFFISEFLWWLTRAAHLSENGL